MARQPTAINATSGADNHRRHCLIRDSGGWVHFSDFNRIPDRSVHTAARLVGRGGRLMWQRGDYSSMHASNADGRSLIALWVILCARAFLVAYRSGSVSRQALLLFPPRWLLRIHLYRVCVCVRVFAVRSIGRSTINELQRRGSTTAPSIALVMCNVWAHHSAQLSVLAQRCIRAAFFALRLSPNMITTNSQYIHIHIHIFLVYKETVLCNRVGIEYWRIFANLHMAIAQPPSDISTLMSCNNVFMRLAARGFQVANVRSV